MNVKVNSSRLQAELEALAAFSDSASPAVTRVVFSEVDLAARASLKRQCVEAGLSMREDALGNTFFRWAGSDGSLAAVGTGSHIDAIPNAGRFDGTVGVLGGLEAIRTLQEGGFVPRRSIELLLFTSEEPTRFGIGCLGSRILSGALPAERAILLKDQHGATLEHILANAGFGGKLESVRLIDGYYDAFVELHIEQGPILEREKLNIGVVESIAAPAALRVTVRGSGGHAGAVLMRDRQDALAGAAEVIIAVEAAALSTGERDAVATTGLCSVFPGAVNSVPSEVKLEIDVRDSRLERRDSMVKAIVERCQLIGTQRRLQVEVEILNSDAPARCEPRIVDQIERACEDLELSHTRMVSRAYHDSLFMSRIAPTAMIFIPCYKGLSHRPDEYASAVDIANGVAVLAKTLAALASC